MNKLIAALEDANTRCRVELTKELANRHGVSITTGSGGGDGSATLGLAFFFAFDPLNNYFQCVPGSARFLSAAERIGLISRDEAASLSLELVRTGAEIADRYRGGRFSWFFETPQFQRIIRDPSHMVWLAQSGLAAGVDWVDKLYESCPRPILKDDRLHTGLFRQIKLDEELDYYKRSPWLTWIEALGLVCLGPWVGLRPQAILSMVGALRTGNVRLSPRDLGIEDGVLGYKVTLPVLARGLQGIVTGFFVSKPNSDPGAILSTLNQFGGTMGDVYADLRWTDFVDTLAKEVSDEALARQLVKIVSPVNKIIVRHDTNLTGLTITDEGEYWAGYRRMTNEELALHQSHSNGGYSILGPRNTEIFIEPLDNMPELNSQLLRIRMEANLARAMDSLRPIDINAPLSFGDVQELYHRYRAYKDDDKASQSKLRFFYVIDQVRMHWDRGMVKIVNNNMKEFMEKELDKELSSGYQATSYVADIEKLFNNKITALKAKNAITLSWIKSA